LPAYGRSAQESGHSRTERRTRQIDPERAFLIDPGMEGLRQDPPFLKEASNAPARRIRPKQSNVANRRTADIADRRLYVAIGG
jgi:hypothetical protein